MIKIENVEVVGWEAAIRGMRNPMNSWKKSDSGRCENLMCEVCPGWPDKDDYGECMHARMGDYMVGSDDLNLMSRLAAGGSVHAKYRRMIVVYADITAPLYWWKEADTYKVGTVANSCSTMHKIHERDLTIDDFSHEYLTNNFIFYSKTIDKMLTAKDAFGILLDCININRVAYESSECKDKVFWYRIIQLLGTNYNQKRTWMINYEVLNNIYHSRKNHKLDEWREFCKWIETLPYSEIITKERVS